MAAPESGANQRIEARLRRLGLRPTVQRLAICRYVLEEAHHPTAEDVRAWAERRLPMVSLATVYNTLNLLVRAGLLREFRFPHTGRVVFDSNTAPHYHFVDRDTGALTDIAPEDVEIRPHLDATYEVDEVQVVLQGRRRR